jgi:flavin reductase (DIM6/NTAB) family NADH-FMN oxidoreductase RutF
MRKLDIDPNAHERLRVYKIVAGAVLPRPIGLVSTVGKDGKYNVAPFSWFNALSSDPPYVCVSISNHATERRPKDTLRNILDTGEFVANIVSESMAHAQNVCAQPWPADTDEFEVSGLTPAPSKIVRAPAVLESRVNFECKLFQATPLPRSSYTLCVGEVVHIRVAEEVMEESGRINLGALKPVGRLVGNGYCRISDAFTLDYDSLAEVAKSNKPGSS